MMFSERLFEADGSSLMIGQTIGHYSVTAKLGAGGMGEVYRARDTKLGREVALKVLPEAFAADAQRMARFQREAQVLAALNHPHIAAIYGLEESGTAGASLSSPSSPVIHDAPARAPAPLRALVMELVEGPTLGDRIAGGALPPEEALPIARQIADALEYAHERGIIHRDLKPANIKFTPDGAVKILDFGLAKALAEDVAHTDASTSPTLSIAATKAGIILGTAAYMSPEQARGKPADRRADIWSFGVVLYEMLSGKQLYGGETVSDSMAAVITREPDWAALPQTTPPRVRELLRRCLVKDPRQRLRDIGDARIALEEALAQPEGKIQEERAGKMPALQKKSVLPWAAAAGMTVVALALGGLYFLRPPAGAPPVARFTIHLSDVAKDFSMTVTDVVPAAISPDGKKIAFEARGDKGRQIFLRTLENQEVQPLAGTENGGSPFFSPDSQSIGFFVNNKLKQISVAGGVPVQLADAPTQRGATWAEDNSIIYSPAFDAGLWRVPARGGVPEQLTKPDAAKNERTHRWPFFVPGTDLVLFTIGTLGSPNNYDAAQLAAISLKSGKITLLGERGSAPVYTPSGHLLFGRGRALFAAPFDVRALKITAPPTPVFDQVGCEPASGAFFIGISRNGTLIALPSTASQGLEIVLVDRAGNATPLPLPPRNYQYPRFSPRGDRLVFNATGPSGVEDAWIYSFKDNSLSRLTFEVDAFHPIWTPDSQSIVYSVLTGTTDGLYFKSADGSGQPRELMAAKGTQPVPAGFLPDGKSFVFMHTGSIPDLAMMRVDSPEKMDFVVKTPTEESSPAVSSDGRWLAYTSTESGRGEVYVTQLPGAAGRWQVSPEGGDDPLWSADMKEMFFKRGDDYFSVPIRTSPSFQAGTPKLMFSGKFERPILWIGNWDVSPDGKKFALVRPFGNAPRFAKILVTLNWSEELRQRAPAK